MGSETKGCVADWAVGDTADWQSTGSLRYSGFAAIGQQFTSGQQWAGFRAQKVV